MSRLAPFADLFSRPTWANALLLLAGTLLAPGRRTVTAALRVLGREHETDDATYHRVLARAQWSSREVAGRLLHLLVDAFVAPGSEIVVGLDDTVERRWGPKIEARAIHRDPVRSSRGHFVETSGLRRPSAMLITAVPWANRLMALPVLTALVPSERFYAHSPRAPKALLDAARQMVLQIRRWLPGRRLVVVADSAFAAIAFLAALAPHACVVTRLRLDANLFAPAPPRRKGARGRPPLKGARRPKLAAVLAGPATVWSPHVVPLWYGQRDRPHGHVGTSSKCRPTSAAAWSTPSLTRADLAKVELRTQDTKSALSCTSNSATSPCWRFSAPCSPGTPPVARGRSPRASRRLPPRR